MENNERIVKGIWIPIEIWQDKSLSWNEKILLMEIDSFTDKDKECFFSDEYIADMLGVNKTNANRILSSLVKKGLVEKVSFDGRRRSIRSLLESKADLLFKAEQGCRKKQGRLAEKSNIPNKDNNTSYYNQEKVSKDTSKKFDFKAALLSLDIPEDVVDDFLAVRRSKKATNTKTAFNILKEEINKSQHTATSIIKFCIGKNWMGFKVSYLKPEDYAELEKRPDYRPNYPRPIFPDEDPALKYLRMAKEAEEQRCREMQK